MTRARALPLTLALTLGGCAAFDETSTTIDPWIPPTGPMMVSGRAGYVPGTVPGVEGQFLSTYVGAWGEGPRVRFCTQTLGESDGRFVLLIPASCFAEGETVHLTSGGLNTCVSRPFHQGSRVEVELLGRSGDC